MRKANTLTTEHQLLLDDAAIPAKYASKLGIKSVTDAAELPPELEHLRELIPGIIYPLPRLDGTVVNQLRIDNPQLDDDGKPMGKYRQEPGSGTVISLWGCMRERVGKATTLVIVEGTKQAVSASRLLEDDEKTLVVGIQGCWGWASNQAMAPDLVDILHGGSSTSGSAIKKVIVVFDADIAENLRVWQAAKALRQAIESASSVSSRGVRFASLAFLGGKQGLDDYMGSMPEVKRKAKLEALLSSAGALGRAPSTKSQASSVKIDRGSSRVEVDMEKGQIVEITEKFTQEGEPFEETKVLLGAAAVIRRSEQVISSDPLQEPEQNLYLEVAIPTTLGVERFYPIAVPDAKLSDVGYWLRSVPKSKAATVGRSSKPDDTISIAIREASTEIEHTSVVKRTGWVNTDDPSNPRWVWASYDGGIGTYGLDPGIVGRPNSQDWAKIRLADPDFENEDIPDKYDSSKAKKIATENFLTIDQYLANPLHWHLIICAVGLAFLPIVPNVALGYFGRRSSGKSTLAQAAAACYTPDWGPLQTPMASFNASASALDLTANGLHDAILHVDDLKPESSQRAQENVLQGLDALLRRSFGSGGRKRGTVDRSSGGVGMAQTDDAAPLVIVTGERVPTGPTFPESGLDRMIITKLYPESTFKHRVDDNGHEDDGSLSLKEFYHQVKTGNFPLMLASYLQYIASLIEGYPLSVGANLEAVAQEEPRDPLAASHYRMEHFRTWLEEKRDIWTAKFDSRQRKDLRDARVSDRAKRSAGGLMLGIEMFTRFAMNIGVMDEEDALRLRDDVFDGVLDLIIDGSYAYMSGNHTESDALMEAIKSVLASKRATLNPDEATGAIPLIGEIKNNVQGQRAVVLNHAMVAEVIKYPQGAPGVANALSDVLIRQPSQKGLAVRQRIGGQSLRCIAIKMDKWDPEGVFEAQLSADF